MSLSQVCESRFDDFGDLQVKSAASRRVDRTLQRLLEQRVLKDVNTCWGLTFCKEEARRHQLCQLASECLFVEGYDCRQQLVVKLVAKRGGKLGHIAVARDPIEPDHHKLLQRRRQFSRSSRHGPRRR